MEADITCL